MIHWYDHDGVAMTSQEWCAKTAADPLWVRVAETFVGERRVSTVLLGLDHGLSNARLIFETMTFPDMEICERYSTKEQALDGHARIVARCEREAA